MGKGGEDSSKSLMVEIPFLDEMVLILKSLCDIFWDTLYTSVKIDIFVKIDIPVKFYFCVKLSHLQVLTILSIAFDIFINP